MKLAIFACLFFFTYGGQQHRYFMSIRYVPMEGKIPPIPPLLYNVPMKTMCALLCVNDESCACFSHSPVVEFCFLSEEVMRPIDVIYSTSIDHFYHFNVHEVISNSSVSLLPGYRWYPEFQIAIRFRYYFPQNSTDATAICQSQGGDLIVIDSEEKSDKIKSIIGTNIKLQKEEKSFLVQLSNTTELMNAPKGTGNCRAIDHRGVNHTFIATDCSYKLPYICEQTF